MLKDGNRKSSSLMEVLSQHQRSYRLRAVRLLARALTICALVVLATTAVISDQAYEPSTPLIGAFVGGGLAAWLVTLVLDIRVHSNRLNSRMIMMRLQSVQADIDKVRLTQPPDSVPSGYQG